MRRIILLSFYILFVTIYFHAEIAADNVFPDHNGTCINDFAKLINPQDENTRRFWSEYLAEIDSSKD